MEGIRVAMNTLIKYFLHGAVGLVFGQTIGFFIPTSFLGGSRLVLIFALSVWWGVFGAYIGLLWNKMLKIGAVGIVCGFSGGLVWYGLIYPPFSIWGAGFFLPGILFSVFLLIGSSLNYRLNIKNLLLFIGILFAVILISVFQGYTTTLENKFTGVVPPLIGFFSFVFSLIIIGGLIGIGFYQTFDSNGINKNGSIHIFLKLGRTVSVIWILFMFVFALGASHDAGYFIKKIDEPEFFALMGSEEINRYPYFAETINEIEKGTTIEYSIAVPREEWNALSDYLGNQKNCRSKDNGNCYVKINNSFYEISFWTE